jgi:hypothetical protein
MGITSVHVNRIVKQLRDDNILEFHRGSVRVIDEQKLWELADFDGLYLHQRHLSRANECHGFTSTS